MSENYQEGPKEISNYAVVATGSTPVKLERNGREHNQTQLCLLAAFLLASCLSTTCHSAWAWDAQSGGNPTGGQATLLQNYLNQTGQYQGGGHSDPQVDPSFGGVNQSSSQSSGGGGGGSQYQSPVSELEQSENNCQVSASNPNPQLSNTFPEFGGTQQPLNQNSGKTQSGNLDKPNKSTQDKSTLDKSAKDISAKDISAKSKDKSRTLSSTNPYGSSAGTWPGDIVEPFPETGTSGGQNSFSGQASPSVSPGIEVQVLPAQPEPHFTPAQTCSTPICSGRIIDNLRNGSGVGRNSRSGGNCLGGAAAAVQAGGAAVLGQTLQQAPGANSGQARANQNAQKQQGADNLAAMERYHAAAAIDWVRSFLTNFTTDGSNKWNQIRNHLFVPIALLLLLPGAVICQVKAVVASGIPVLGEVSPFEGIMRSIVAIFLIPATYLIVNYGIDIANSLTLTIAQGYSAEFGTDMYVDAFCGHVRAFPIREPEENPGMITNQQTQMFNYFGNTPLAHLEGKTLAIKYEDPCTGLYILPPDRNNDDVPYMVNEQRLAFNQTNAAFAMAWVILCAVQQTFLHYLWFVGPIVAALWVYPAKQLRDAFPGWIEGCLTLCFWSLLWSVCILLMACFRGVDDTGTIVFTALNILTVGCAKFAFDFTGLVKDMGREAVKMSERAAAAAARASAAGRGGG